jgi:MraZ protein
MAMGFRGTYEHSLDDKGRTSVPSRFRRVFSKAAKANEAQEGASARTALILSPSDDGCLIAWTLDRWIEFEANVLGLPRFRKDAVWLRRFMLAEAEEVQVDSSGRILLPARMREEADIRTAVLWKGEGDMCELWSPERFNAVKAREGKRPDLGDLVL